MGVYRLILAALVAISHTGIDFFGYNPGVVAVISFYLLSGYVMTILIDKYYKDSFAISAFYLDRAARLFPQFLFYMLLASGCIYFFKIESPFTYQLNFFKWVLNFFILPQGFFMYWADGALVIPQSWSLGLEMTFYLVIPWILMYCPARWIYGLSGISFIIFLMAYFGKVNSDYFGYRLLPGTLFMFLVGSSFYKNNNDAKKFRAIVFLSVVALLLFAFLKNTLYQLRYNKEVLVGLILGIICVNILKESTFSKIDEFFGNLSYGVFLNHFIVIWIMQKFFAVKCFNTANVAILLFASCALAFGSFLFVERPALKWRRRIRYGVN